MKKETNEELIERYNILKEISKKKRMDIDFNPLALDEDSTDEPSLIEFGIDVVKSPFLYVSDWDIEVEDYTPKGEKRSEAKKGMLKFFKTIGVGLGKVAFTAMCSPIIVAGLACIVLGTPSMLFRAAVEAPDYIVAKKNNSRIDKATAELEKVKEELQKRGINPAEFVKNKGQGIE